MLGRLVKQEELAVLREAINNLPRHLKAPFVATVLDGYSYREAVELLELPLGTVASRVHAARGALAKAMQEVFPEVSL